ncbi:unnamed protein product [Closterium sp. Naga37s-1]|nr:unnamed protein product [Closterium sp. Naga37s-1]
MSGMGGKSSTGKSTWKWVPFPCAPPETPVGEWISSLTRRGIREISIAGDSHHRMLATHLFYLLTGEAELRHWIGKHDLAFVARNERNETLRINYYWVDGIYRNDEFGCTPAVSAWTLLPCAPLQPPSPCPSGPTSPPEEPSHNTATSQHCCTEGLSQITTTYRGAFSHHYDVFPNISRSSDVIIINSGYWAGRRSPNGGGSSSIASRFYEGPATNLFLSAANRLTKHLADQINAGSNAVPAAGPGKDDGFVPRIEFFDSWQVEAPRFMDVCPHDHHYHCYGSVRRGKVVMRGGVGEAVVRSLIHYIEHGGNERH